MERERIIELSKKKNFTDQEKGEIREAAKEMGLNVKFNGKCPNCYSDAVMLMRSATSEEKPAQNGKKWRYLRSCAQVWNGKVIDDDTDDAIIDEFVKIFPQFFALNENDTTGDGDSE